MRNLSFIDFLKENRKNISVKTVIFRKMYFDKRTKKFNKSIMKTKEMTEAKCTKIKQRVHHRDKKYYRFEKGIFIFTPEVQNSSRKR